MKKNSKNTNETINMLFSIIRSFDALSRYLRIELKIENVTPIQFAIMNALYIHGGRMTPTHISKWVFRSKHTITSDISTLEKGGYVRREPGINRRSVEIVMTQKGRDKTNKIIPHAKEMSWKALSCFSVEEGEAFIILHRKLRKHLTEQIANSLGA